MQLSNLINYLNTITSITDKVGNRIFWGIPITEQTEDYITVNIVTENQPTKVEKRNRIEFRIIWWDTATTYDTLQDIDKELVNSLRDYTQDWVYKTTISNYANWYDEKQRKVLVRDLILFYTT